MNRIKKSFCVLLSLLFILTALSSVLGAVDTCSILFNTEESIAKISNVSDASVSYYADADALKVTATGTAPCGTLTFDSFSNASEFAVITYRNPSTNSTQATKIKLTFLKDDTAVTEKSITLVKGAKSYSAVLELGKISADSVKINFFTSCSAGDTLFLYGISFYSTRSEAQSAAASAEKSANGKINGYSESQLTLSSYDLDAYVTPYWDTDIIYNEAVYPLMNSDGTIDDITLMYDADRILSVRSSTLTTEYKEGVDYELVDGKLRILTTGNIPCVSYSSHYFTSNVSNTYRMLAGGYVRFQEGTAITLQQLAITYVRGSDWTGYIPTSQGEELSRTTSKLENGDDLNIVFFGDSITNGGNSSSVINVAPYADMWATMLEKELTNRYPSANINCYNTSVSGGCVSDALANVQNSIINYSPDLLILALGTNDSQFERDASRVLSEMQSVLDAVRGSLPNCEIIIVAPMFSNPECFSKSYLYEYREGFYKMAEADGIVVADVMAVHDYLLTRKSYTDMSANNLCHLNDTFARVYVQTVMKTISTNTPTSTYKESVKSRIERTVAPSNYPDGIRPAIESLIASAKAQIDSATLTSEVDKIYRDTVQTAVATAAGEYTGDFSSLIFSSEKMLQYAGDIRVAILGDANGDGSLKSSDFILLKKAIVCEIVSLDEEASDINGDGLITIKDLLLLKKTISGYIEKKTSVFSNLKNISYSADSTALRLTPNESEYMYLTAPDSIDSPHYAVIVYKADSTSAASATAYFTEDHSDNPTTITFTCDDDYSYLIIELPTGASSSGISIDTSALSMEIDSFGIFETYSEAYSFAYERLWDRRSAKVWTDNITLTFTESTAQYITAQNSTDFDCDDSSGVIRLTVTSAANDPFVNIDLSSLDISADEYKYIVYTYMLPTSNSSSAAQAQIFLCAGSVESAAESSSVRFALTANGSYVKKTIDLSQASYWNGSVHSVRLDYFTGAASGDTCYVKSITFCKTEADAQKALLAR